MLIVFVLGELAISPWSPWVSATKKILESMKGCLLGTPLLSMNMPTCPTNLVYSVLQLQ